MEGPLVYALVGMLTCFLGTLPFGPINLSVVKTTVDYNHLRGIEVAIAASLVEIIQALIAISFGMLISAYLDSNALIKVAIASVFILLAGIVFTRKPAQVLNPSATQQSFLWRGLVIAALNPQAVPFWIFALAAISQYAALTYSGLNLAGFLIGVFAGKLLALFGFVYASNYLKSHLQQSSKLVNRVLASVLLLIGISQLINAL